MNKYPSPLIVIHWMTVILVLTAYATSGDPTRGATTMDFLVGQIHVLSGSLLVSIHRNSIDTGKMRRSSLDPTFLLA
ncbi:hypothetical protein [Aeromonas caviae]|uniref:hypothetical protein n=1 Tax=Aeromonas caviae TaxID=648 RepID=UPI002F3F1DC6